MKDSEIYPVAEVIAPLCIESTISVFNEYRTGEDVEERGYAMFNVLPSISLEELKGTTKSLSQ